MPEFLPIKAVNAKAMTAEQFYTTSDKPLPQEFKHNLSAPGYRVVYGIGTPEEYNVWLPEQVFAANFSTSESSVKVY